MKTNAKDGFAFQNPRKNCQTYSPKGTLVRHKAKKITRKTKTLGNPKKNTQENPKKSLKNHQKNKSRWVLSGPTELSHAEEREHRIPWAFERATKWLWVKWLPGTPKKTN